MSLQINEDELNRLLIPLNICKQTHVDITIKSPKDKHFDNADVIYLLTYSRLLQPVQPNH